MLTPEQKVKVDELKTQIEELKEFIMHSPVTLQSMGNGMFFSSFIEKVTKTIEDLEKL
ncbi:MAG: hypothetical protein N2043_02325 [Ignavibacterium sp.]|nr:hypothetical protein [Ignavibacterium sp.]